MAAGSKQTMISEDGRIDGSILAVTGPKFVKILRLYKAPSQFTTLFPDL